MLRLTWQFLCYTLRTRGCPAVAPLFFLLLGCGPTAVLAGLAFFVAPNMKVDPAEMEQIQAEMKDSPFGLSLIHI